MDYISQTNETYMPIIWWDKLRDLLTMKTHAGSAQNLCGKENFDLMFSSS